LTISLRLGTAPVADADDARACRKGKKKPLPHPFHQCLAHQMRQSQWRSREATAAVGRPQRRTKPLSWLNNNASGRTPAEPPLGPLTDTANPLKVTVHLSGNGDRRLPCVTWMNFVSVDVQSTVTAPPLLTASRSAHHTPEVEMRSAHTRPPSTLAADRVFCECADPGLA